MALRRSENSHHHQDPRIPAKVPRRTVFALAGGAALAVGLGVAPRAWAKVAQQQAGYKPTPQGPNRCDKCLQYQPPAGCKIVDGQVSPQGSCNYFTAKG